ncbi:uncharacterized protein EV422DRAFT_336553 [Fimicolochytrium jonesii]|uniref:uncharacterized protein n=1 Tax=Fimicolochytrium jonesii TaxID=1396493 RepID=UPI0022FE41AF|nr:uncharacterized protein EV422DRAFT_336553 [Fimicolochytrium jonesii]KAI8815949.1 hypothetical protein EV422DRAFT_336553 [Fimicolochytrium jonesii]
MDDLGDLAWKSHGFAAKPSVRNNATGNSTPLNQLGAGSTNPAHAGIGGANAGIRNNATPPSFSPSASSSTTPRMASASAGFVPLSSNQQFGNVGSGANNPTAGIKSFTSLSSQSGASASHSRSASPRPPAPTGSGDVFGNLVSFGGASAAPKQTLGNMTMDQQRRAQEQQKAGYSQPQQVQQQQSGLGSLGNFGAGGGYGSGVSSGRNSGTATPNLSRAYGGSGGVASAQNALPSKNDFADLFSGRTAQPAAPTPLGSGLGKPLQAMGNKASQASQPAAQSNDAWNLDFLASGGASAASSTMNNGPGKPHSDDPFDLEFLGAQSRNGTPASEPVASLPGISGAKSHTADDDNFLGLLGRPVSEMPKPKPAPPPAPVAAPIPQQASSASHSRASSVPVLSKQSAESTSLDFAIAQILDMGFDHQSARTALEATGNDVTAAIDLLVQNREAQQEIREHPDSARGKPAASRQQPQQPSPSHAHRVTKFKDDYEDESSDSDYPGSGARRGNRSAIPSSRADYQHARESSAGSSNASAGLTQEKLVQTASAIGTSVFKNAKSMLNYSKQKITAVVEKAQAELDAASSGARPRQQQNRRGGYDDEYDDGDQEAERRYYESKEREGHQRDDSDEEDNAPGRGQSPRLQFKDEGDDGSSRSKSSQQQQQQQQQSPRSQQQTNHSAPQKEFRSSPSHQQASQHVTSLSFAAQTSPAPVRPPAAAAPAPAPRKPTPPPAVTATPQQLEQSNLHKEAGNAHFKQGQFGDAEESYTHSINALPDLHTNLTALYNNRAAARLKTGHYREAVEDCTYVQRMDAKDLKSLLRRATAWEALEKWENARDDYKAVMAIDPSVKAASTGLARAQKALKPLSESTPAVVAQSAATVPVVAARSAFADFEQPVSKPMDPYVANAVNTAVAKLREQNEAAENEENMKLALKDQTDDLINRWRRGKEDNLRALLSSLDTVLWSELKWTSINLSELITPQQVKIKYMRAVARVHPDKLSQDATVEHRLIANGVFGTLNKGWDAFKAQNGLN